MSGWQNSDRSRDVRKRWEGVRRQEKDLHGQLQPTPRPPHSDTPQHTPGGGGNDGAEALGLGCIAIAVVFVLAVFGVAIAFIGAILGVWG
ncbi:hypothetical protein GCM10010313_20480 [Streptomyces violarus]|uniref:Uncharacterized protein n=1 Tax=Streptomyces violarus TaxID=67380 RepID=A0A7W5F0I0_9ACTN|nr:MULTISPECIES: hypothetical protein [Streptomyces]MBB3075572.1 hypothetical protein [Streptomyces violarus]WRT98165.1 hypothetical protein VJ737_10925 [Streptomyces sp. CGMCC 4.1772]GHD04324.1 hypothetical protein GCM10010313_20480 [Streptomyces violarus]